MTLHLKCISNVKMKNKPFFSKNFKKEKWLDALQSIRLNSSSDDESDDEPRNNIRPIKGLSSFNDSDSDSDNAPKKQRVKKSRVAPSDSDSD